VTDAFVHDDAAYVLGALSADERAAFEAHLHSCAECAARVREIQDVPALFAGISAAELSDATHTVPETLLPGLLRRAAAQRRRRRWVVGGLASVAAACLIALTVVLWPTSSASTAPTRKFVALVANPVVASASLTPKPWGTEINVDCSYADRGAPEARIPYEMYVFDRSGNKERVGSWWQPDHDIKYETGTALSTTQIAKVEITLPNGTPILRLTN
jgi:hypothetical protein